jgi:ABC-type sugar transport system ATPase subunit
MIAVEARNISKSFGVTRALNDVSVSIEAGTICAFAGENGAGKSTLGKIIAGVITPDEGQLVMHGREVRYANPRDAMADGVALVAQELALVPYLSAAENVFLGQRLGGRFIHTARHARREYEAVRSRTGFDVPGDATVASLSVAQRQQVEILRAVSRDARVVIMDEPTSALTPAETDHLHDKIRALKAEGRTIIYVSHFLEETLELVDTVVVLRNGTFVKAGPAAGETVQTLTTSMLGRSVDAIFPDLPASRSERVALEAKGLSRAPRFEDVSFTLHDGEILGLAGLVGAGRSELARVICGADRPDAGRVELAGEPVSFGSPRAAIDAGIAFVPEDRRNEGLFGVASLAHNIVLPHLPASGTHGIVRSGPESEKVAALLSDLAVVPEDPRARVEQLSGGNQQKVLFAKWLYRRPKVLVLDEPTRGVDVGAKVAIYRLIADLAASGMAVLLISSEIEELVGLSHRVLVMRQGTIRREVLSPAEQRHDILAAALGADTPAGV